MAQSKSTAKSKRTSLAKCGCWYSPSNQSVTDAAWNNVYSWLTPKQIFGKKVRCYLYEALNSPRCVLWLFLFQLVSSHLQSTLHFSSWRFLTLPAPEGENFQCRGSEMLRGSSSHSGYACLHSHHATRINHVAVSSMLLFSPPTLSPFFFQQSCSR